MKEITTRHSACLTPLVDYRDVCRWSRISQRSVERMVRRGEFPKPIPLPSKIVRWEAKTVQDWMKKCIAGGGQIISHPEDLTAEAIPAQLQSLAAKFISAQMETDVRSEDVTFHIERRSLDSGSSDWTADILAEFDGRFDHFDVARSVLAVAWLFPAFRDLIDAGEQEEIREILSDPDQLRYLGCIAIDDEAWADNEDRITRMMGRPSNSPPTNE